MVLPWPPCPRQPSTVRHPVGWATPSRRRQEPGAACAQQLGLPGGPGCSLIWWMPWWTDTVLRREAGTESLKYRQSGGWWELKCPFCRGEVETSRGGALWAAPTERDTWEVQAQPVSLVTGLFQTQPDEAPRGGSLQICREEVPACGWEVTGRLASVPQVARRQVVPGRQRLDSSKTDLLTSSSRLGGFSLTVIFIPL